MEYIAYGGVITNRLLYTDKTCIQDIMGGSGFYSFSALRLCTPKGPAGGRGGSGFRRILRKMDGP